MKRDGSMSPEEISAAINGVIDIHADTLTLEFLTDLARALGLRLRVEIVEKEPSGN